MSAAMSLELLRLLAAQPMLTEAEARRELGLPESPPDREDRPEPKQDDEPAVKSKDRRVAVA